MEQTTEVGIALTPHKRAVKSKTIDYTSSTVTKHRKGSKLASLVSSRSTSCTIECSKPENKSNVKAKVCPKGKYKLLERARKQAIDASKHAKTRASKMSISGTPSSEVLDLTESLMLVMLQNPPPSKRKIPLWEWLRLVGLMILYSLMVYRKTRAIW